MRVDSVASARCQLSKIRKEMSDASHHAYAFRVGYGASVTEGKSDDGEPKGTAGAPILAVLRGSDIGDILVVVTRYFGGRKLGTGGLVRAYGDAAREAIAKLSFVERIEKTQFILKVPYPFLDRIRRLMVDFGVEEVDCDYSTVAFVEVSLASSDLAKFQDAVQEMSAARVEFR